MKSRLTEAAFFRLNKQDIKQKSIRKLLRAHNAQFVQA
jgi:hypothetical protein